MISPELQELLDLLSNAPVTFSRNCCSGYIGDGCQCWRCRKGRGQEPDEKLAEEVAGRARAAHVASYLKARFPENYPPTTE